jgi:hypothetical protein
MADAVEYDIISLPGQDDAPPGQVDLEPATDQYDRCRSPLVRDPFRTPLTALVNSPSDLDVIGAPDIVGGHEVAENPSAAFFPVHLGVAGIDQI